MRIGYFDCSSGIAGDMILGSMIDAGLKEKDLISGLRVLKVPGLKISSRKVKRTGLYGTKVKIAIRDKKERRSFSEIGKILEDSDLDRDLKDRAGEILGRLAEAESCVHGRKKKEIHLEYIDAIDLLVDIVGSLIGIRCLGLDEVSASPINTGSGFIQGHHGRLPVPAPATSELLKGVPIYSSGIPHELTTPTGAAIITTIADSFGQMPRMKLTSIGSGAGSLDLASQPNLLRLFIGGKEEGDKGDRVVLIEANIDDMNPQIYEYLMERLFDLGALDVFLTPIIMKKGRPGIMLGILALPDQLDKIKEVVFDETTTIGLRISDLRREVLQRTIKRIKTGYGEVRVKIIKGDAGRLRLAPEYDDLKRIARSKGISLRRLMEEIKKEIGSE